VNACERLIVPLDVATIDEARAIVDRSFPVERFEPRETDQWEQHYRRFREYVELACA